MFDRLTVSCHLLTLCHWQGNKEFLCVLGSINGQKSILHSTASFVASRKYCIL